MSTTTINTDLAPRVWIGCLACYNEGRLVGDWHDAVDAAAATTYDIHGAHSRADNHDELWCFDIENFPISREMSPHEAAKWGEALTSIDEHLRPALHAWVRSGSYTAEGDTDLPATGEFTDRYLGHHDSFEDYLRNVAEDTAMFRDVDETLQRYFDWARYSRDEQHSYSVIDAGSQHGGGVYVFIA